MNDPKLALIGAETEYGIYIETEDGRVFGGSDGTHIIHIAIAEMMRESLKLTGGLCLDEEKITTIAEHEEVERHVRDQKYSQYDEEPVRKDDPRSVLPLRQRRGYTGSMLHNGARFYQDMGHPEYSIPECADPYAALCAGKAGDKIVERLASIVEPAISKHIRSTATVRILKNNSDGMGKSYAGHENYLVARSLFNNLMKVSPESDLTTLFFVARQIITGAGKIGSEQTRTPVPFQISQRADFFVRNFSESTTNRRGIINLRDVPYADPDKWGRFHVIVGDSNRSDLSNYLKFGMSSIFFTMMNTRLMSDFKWWGAQLAKPARALKLVSKDTTLTRKLVFTDGRETTAIEFMRDLAKYAKKFVLWQGYSQGTWLEMVDKWLDVLDGLESDRHAHPLARSLDWVVLERIVEDNLKHGRARDSEECSADDLSYRTLSSDSLFKELEDCGDIIKLANEATVQKLTREAPAGTRAGIRAEIIRRYPEHIAHMRWDSIEFVGGYELWIFDPGWGDTSKIEDTLFSRETLPLPLFLKKLVDNHSTQVKVIEPGIRRARHER